MSPAYGILLGDLDKINETKDKEEKNIFFRRELFRRPHLRTELPYFNQHAEQGQVLPVDNLI